MCARCILTFHSFFFFFFKQKTAYELLISDWSSDVCSSDLKKPSANAAAIKAFAVNRVGDLGFMLGIFGTFLVFGTVSIPEILAAAPGMAGSTIGFMGMRLDTMTILCLLLFIGAMGKSAQLGLQDRKSTRLNSSH